jgi:hypothetical protein
MRHDFATTHTMVSDMHHIITKGQEGADGGDLPVGFTRTLFIAE